MSDSAPLIVEGGANQRAPSLRQADYDADGTELKKITSRCKHYLVFSILRWFALATVAIALGIHMRGTITDWYRGEQAVAHCQTCVLHAQVAPDTLFEFAQCQTLPAFANARDKMPNLLIAGGSDFRGTPGSDVEYQNAFIIIAYCFALIILGAYLVVVVMCGAGKQANDAQNALDEFSRMGLTINVHASIITMLILFFSFSLVKIDECYLRPYPRGLGIGFLLTLLFGLICLIVSACLPFCVGAKHLSTLIFLVVGSIAIFASHCTLLSIVAYLGTGAGPRWVLAVGILSFLFAFETIYFAIFSRRRVVEAFLYRVERDY